VLNVRAAALALATGLVTALVATSAPAATTITVKSVAYCKAGKTVLLDFRAAQKVSDQRAGLKYDAKTQKDLAKLKNKAPGQAAKKHVKVLTTTFTKLIDLALSIPDGTQPTQAQTARFRKLGKAYHSAYHDFGRDLAMDGCGPNLKG
jgi:hypothetical protein